jgi:alpha-glucosidase
MIRRGVLRALTLLALVAAPLAACDCSPVPTPGPGALSWDRDQPQGVELARLQATFNNTTGALIVTDRRTGRVILENVPGRAFVGARRGSESISEGRGLFYLSDATTASCGGQHITGWGPGNDDGVLIVVGHLLCSTGEVPYRLEMYAQLEGQVAINLDVGGGYNRTMLYPAVAPGAEVYGGGIQFSAVNLRGRQLPILVSEQGIGRGAQPVTFGANTAGAGGQWYHSYAPAPHVITSDLQSWFLTNTEPSVLDLRGADHIALVAFSSSLTARAVSGETPLELVERYTGWAGRMRRLPDWVSAGAIIGMQGGDEKVREVWATLSDADTPIAAFWLQDWCGQRITSFGKQLWWNWELDTDRYPGWEAMSDDLAAEGIRTMIYVNPFLADVSEKENARRNLFEEAREQGFLVTEDGEPYLLLNTDFSAGLLDLSNPDAVAWMQTVLEEEVLSTGASGWMADFGEGLPFDGELAADDAFSFHNAYPERWARLNRELIDRTAGGEDLVFFTRSGFSRSPRYSTLFWLGDQMVTWDADDGLKSAIVGMLTGGFSGFTLLHSDIGGYTAVNNVVNYHRSPELLQRWTEMAAFSPVFRTHEGILPEENHQIFDDAESAAHFGRMARAYVAWADYRRELLDDAAERGTPIVRHPWLLFPDEPLFRGLTFEQYFVGDELLVAPVSDPGATAVNVRFPSGDWVHLFTGEVERFDTPTLQTVQAPIGTPAVFFRAGSAVGEAIVSNLRDSDVIN